ncbi:MAG: response regulator [Planctomycetota bacterium]
MAKIIIVEDDVGNGMVLSVLLSRLGGHEVRLSMDPVQILELCRAGAVDLVVMDVSLAGCSYLGEPINGLEITQLLKAHAATRDIPVLLCTAHAMAGDRERFLQESSADAYLGKPVDNRTLLNEVARLLANRPARDQDQSPAPKD